MNYETRMDSFAFERSTDIALQRTQPECAILDELVRVLVQHPGGLRRWSVMRMIRTERQRKSRDIPQKFEDEIERAFRRACATTDNAQGAPVDALFFKPREKAGEVWAVFPRTRQGLARHGTQLTGTPCNRAPAHYISWSSRSMPQIHTIRS